MTRWLCGVVNVARVLVLSVSKKTGRRNGSRSRIRIMRNVLAVIEQYEMLFVLNDCADEKNLKFQKFLKPALTERA